MNSLGAVILFALILGVLTLPSRWALLAMVGGILYLGFGAGLQIGGLNLYPARVLGYVCFLRVCLRGEFSVTRLVRVDKAFILLYFVVTTVLLLRAETPGLLPVARMLDNLLTYFAFRGLIQTPDEFRWLLRMMVGLLIPYVVFLAVERIVGINPFVVLGNDGKTWFRDGTPRCFGSFRHPALLGSLGASFFPLFIALAFDPAVRRRAVFGSALCVCIVAFSNSGGPMSLLIVAALGSMLWRFRTNMNYFRRALVIGICALGLVMKAPIWYIPAKVSRITGGTGWHRSRLMEVAYQNLSEWWLIGMPVEKTKDWLPYNLGATGGADITNQFLGFGLDAGLLGMGLFIYVIYCGFCDVGKALRVPRSFSDKGYEEALLWGAGVVLAAHVFNWIGITYFDQFFSIWLLQFAALVALSQFWLHGPGTAPDMASSRSEQAPGLTFERSSQALS